MFEPYGEQISVCVCMHVHGCACVHACVRACGAASLGGDLFVTLNIGNSLAESVLISISHE